MSFVLNLAELQSLLWVIKVIVQHAVSGLLSVLQIGICTVSKIKIRMPSYEIRKGSERGYCIQRKEN